MSDIVFLRSVYMCIIWRIDLLYIYIYIYPNSAYANRLDDFNSMIIVLS